MRGVRIVSGFMLMFGVFAMVLSILSINSSDVNIVYAVDNIEDNIENSVSQQGSNTSENSNFLGGVGEQSLNQEDQDVADWLKNKRNVTADQLENASKTLTPVTDFIGYIIGGIIIILMSGVALITASDLLYISIPPIRGVLYKGNDGNSAGVNITTSSKKLRWISDEAVACAGMLEGSSQGSSSYSNIIGASQPQQNMSTKSVIATYFRKRIFFLLFLALCVIVLTSSVVMDCGINLAEWVLKLITTLNSSI